MNNNKPQQQHAFRMTQKRLVYFAEPSPEHAQRMEHMRDRLKGEGTSPGTLDQIKTRIQELEQVSSNFNLGETIKTRLNAFLEAKGLKTIDDLSGLKSEVEQMRQQEHLETLEQVDDVVENTMMRVYLRKGMAEDLKDMPSTTADGQKLQQGLATAFETVMTAEFGTQLENNDRLRNPEGRYYFRVVEARNELRKFRSLGKGPENARGTEDGIAYYNERTNNNRLFNYWYEIEDNVPVMYAIDSETHTIQRWKADEIGFQTIKTYPGRDINEVRTLAMRDNFETARRHMARSLGNQIREQALRLDRNNPFSRHIPSLREEFQRDYQESIKQRVTREQGGTDFMEKVSNKINQLFDMTGGLVAWMERNFGGLYQKLSEWFSAEPGIRKAPIASPKTAPDQTPDQMPGQAPKISPSENPELAPDRSAELIREGWQNELPWGTFTIGKNDQPEMLTKLKDKADGVRSRQVTEVRLNGRLKNLNFEIDDSKHELVINPEVDGQKYEQVVIEGNYSLLVENTLDNGQKSYERLTMRIEPEHSPQPDDIQLLSSQLNQLEVKASSAGVELAALRRAPRGWRYQLDGQAVLREAARGKINIELDGNRILFKESTGPSPINELRPGNHVEVPIQLVKGSETISKTLELVIDYPPNPSRDDLEVQDLRPEAENHFAIRRGDLSAGETLLTLEKHNNAVQWTVSGRPERSPKAENDQWFEIDQATGAVKLKTGKNIPVPASGREQLTLTVTAEIPGKPNGEQVSRTIRVDIENLITRVEANDVAPQGLSKDSLPQRLVGAEVTAQNSPVKLFELNERRSGITFRQVRDAKIVDAAGQAQDIAIALDNPQGKQIQLTHTPGGNNTLTPGSRLRLSVAVFNESASDTTGTPTGTQTIEIQIPQHEAPKPEEAALREGHDQRFETTINPHETLAELQPLPESRARGVTRSIKTNSAQIDGRPLALKLDGNQVKYDGTDAISITAPRRIRCEVEVRAGGQTESYPVTIEVRPPTPAPAEAAMLLVNGRAQNSDILYWGALGGSDRAPETIAEFSDLAGEYARRIETPMLNNRSVNSAKIKIENNRLVLDPSLTITPPARLSFQVMVTAPNQAPNTATRQNITIEFRNPEDRHEQATRGRLTDEIWRKSVERARSWSGSGEILIREAADDQWEVMNDGQVNLIKREGSGNDARLVLESPALSGSGTNKLRVEAAHLDKAIYLASLANRVVAQFKSNSSVFTESARRSGEYFIADTSDADDIECNGGQQWTNTTAVDEFRYRNLRMDYISYLNGRMKQYVERATETQTPALEIAREDNNRVAVIDENQVHFDINTGGQRELSRYDYFLSKDGESWTQLNSQHVEINKSDLDITNNLASVYVMRKPKSGTEANPIMRRVELQLQPRYGINIANSNSITFEHLTDASKNRQYTLDVGTEAGTGRSFKIEKEGEDAVLKMTIGTNTSPIAKLEPQQENGQLIISNPAIPDDLRVAAVQPSSGSTTGKIQIRKS